MNNIILLKEPIIDYIIILLVLWNIYYTKTVSFAWSKSRIQKSTSLIRFRADGISISITNLSKVYIILYSRHSIWKRLEKSIRLCRNQNWVSSEITCQKYFIKIVKIMKDRKKLKGRKIPDITDTEKELN
jgi:hypothetical protein